MADARLVEIAKANEAVKESIIENINTDFNVIQEFLRIPQITDDMMNSLMNSLINVSNSTIITNYITDRKSINISSINKMLDDINSWVITLNSSLSDKELLDSIKNPLIILLYEITKIIVKHIKEFKIILNKPDYQDIQDDKTTISQKLAVWPWQDPTKISRDFINDMKVPWSILHFDIFLLYNYNSRTHKQIIDDINSNSFFDYDDFVEFTNIFDKIKEQFKFIYYDRWELSNLSLFNDEYTWVLIHKKSNVEVLLVIESMKKFLLTTKFIDIEYNSLYISYLDKYIVYMNKLNIKIKKNQEAIIEMIKPDKLQKLDELEKLEKQIKKYLLNLNTISKLTERRNKLFSQDNERKVEIEITEQLDELKEILETMSTGVSLIRYNIMDEKKTLVGGGSNTRKKIKQCHNFIKDFTNYIP
jgi:hypothetical protein